MSTKPSIFRKKLLKTSSSPQSRRNLTAFIICLFISFGAWVGIKLFDTYEVEYQVPISFFNVGETEMVSSQSSYLITYKLRANGILNILHKFKPRVDTVFIDTEKSPRVTRNNNTWAFVTKDDLRNIVSRFFTADYQVDKVSPDTIFALVGKAYQKIVPVRVAKNLSFAKGFGMVGSIISEPDSVLVKGPRNIVDTLSAIETMVIRLSDLSSPTTHVTALHSPFDEGLLQVSPSRVRVIIEVEEFTETFFDLPVEVRYSGSYMGKPPKIKLFPERVKVICLVPLRTFPLFDESLIKVYVDVAGGSEALGNLEVKVETSFPDVKIQGVFPSVVESVVLDN